MFRHGTTFVIGAGASAEFGLPVGSQLANLIRRSAKLENLTSRTNQEIGDNAFYETIRRLWPHSADRAKPQKAARDIHEGIHTAVSIDAFIDRFSGDNDIALIGKMLIALEIAKAERQSSMWPENWNKLAEDVSLRILNERQIRLTNPDDTWIGQFFRILCDGVHDPKLLGKAITIICFNYDRCIEYYLRKQISAAYRITLAEAHEIVLNMNIIHPYGTLGELAMNDSGYGDGKMGFGAGIDQYNRLEEIAKNIRTYTEQQHKPGMIKKIHDAIGECNVLVFLGFGFNNQNLDLLRVKEFGTEYTNLPKPVYASGKGISSQVSNTLRRRIGNLFADYSPQAQIWKENVHIEFGQTCGELFETHNMNLSSFVERYVDHEQGELKFVESSRRSE